MRFYAYIRNMLYAQYCIDRENNGDSYNDDIFIKDYLIVKNAIRKIEIIIIKIIKIKK